MLKTMAQFRHEIIYFAEMSVLIKHRKYMKKVIKIEDFIDDMYNHNSKIGSVDIKTNEVHHSYKLIIQTQAKYANLVADFFEFKYFLVIN